jgi:hypothetical protein
MTTPSSSSGPDAEEVRALLAVLSGLRAIADGRLAGLQIAPGEYLGDIYCIQRVAGLLAMELSALGRTLRRPEVAAAEAEVRAIEADLVEALAGAGLRPDDAWLDIEHAVMRGGKPRP